MNRHFRRTVEAQPHPAATHVQNGYRDTFTNDNALASLPTENQHFLLLLEKGKSIQTC
jgi:hypothetical protein